MTNEISNTDDVIDSRDIISRIEELESDLESEFEDYQQECFDENAPLKADFDSWVEKNCMDFETWKSEQDIEELESLQKVAEQGEGYGDWKYGETLINESYFTDYCEEMCKDCGDIPQNVPSYIEIDWEATSENLKADYTEIDFDGVTYYMRA